ncbi:50S ribosomal protein L6 [Pseudomonadota bacterium]
MSRLGRKPIKVPSGLNVKIEENAITISNGKETFIHTFHDFVNVIFDNGEIKVSKIDPKNKKVSKFIGLHRNKIANIIKGLSEGFEVTLELSGVGYRANVVGKILVLGLGYSHDINYSIPNDVEIKCEKNLIKISGSNKEKVGQVAAEIMSFRETEPYKGKGIKIEGQKILRKEGKKK